ncbi:ABC transporter substrate-binding protein [Bifidobacterium sp. ESL0682]|uniref:ABC transporter substrate-binding protein n=1 Tax=Bifidobacterium sp. ESL0682 TaxID=2983212 RepID=UPI0023F7549C|nr:ABC transporter substrate-binding protein [Bifidobacterium sp. ESL0682]WEV42455.1 ABC transporter substrate-binding protein [Bifidobacterium sp. ESL0682]
MSFKVSKAVKSLLVGVCAAAMVASVAACGTTDESDDSTSSKSSAPVTNSVKKDDKIAAMLPDSITKDGKFTVGVSADYAPAEFLDKDGKTPIGYDMDIAKSMAAIFGLKFAPTSAEFDSIMPGIGSKYDVGVSGFTMDPNRKDAGEFVSFLNVGASFVVQKGNPKKLSVDNLCGHSVAVQTGTVHETTVKNLSQQCTAAGKKAIDIQSMKEQTVVATNVATGKADAFCADSPVSGYAVKQDGDKLELLGKAFNMTPEAVVVQKNDMQTAKAVQAALQKLMDDGTYMKILKFWGDESGAIKQAKINDYSDVK